MTNANENRQPKLLPQFLSNMNKIIKISDASIKADPTKTHVPELNEEGKAALRNLAYDYGRNMSGFNPALTPNPDALSDEEVQSYIGTYHAKNIRSATSLVHSSLDSLVQEMDDDAVLNGAGDKDLAQFADDTGHKWYRVYQAVQGAKDLVQRAEAGELKKEEREALVKMRASELHDAKFNELLKKTPNDKYLAGLGANAHIASFLAGHVEAEENYLPAAAKKNAGEAEKNLREYEKANGDINARTYLGNALKAMAAYDLNKARDTLYRIAKK